VNTSWLSPELPEMKSIEGRLLLCELVILF
jgi:hypothetical protein